MGVTMLLVTARARFIDTKPAQGRTTLTQAYDCSLQ